MGIILAISAGSVNQIGVLLQKFVINKNKDNEEFLKNLVRNRVWLFGIILQIVVGGVILFMLAQAYIGPTLVPGLMSAGLVVLAIGSLRILGEILKKQEIIGILLMMIGIILFSMSGFSIDVSSYNFMESGFLIRITIFTVTFIIIALLFSFCAKKFKNLKGILLALESGMIYSLATVWIAPFISGLTRVIRNQFILGQLLLFITSALTLGLATYFGITLAQKSFKEGQVNILSPIIGVPGNFTPIMAYFFIFVLTPPSNLSILLLVLGIVIISLSTIILSKRLITYGEIKTK